MSKWSLQDAHAGLRGAYVTSADVSASGAAFSSPEVLKLQPGEAFTIVVEVTKQ